MDFYSLRILLPALLIDVLITVHYLRERQSSWKAKWIPALAPAPLYLVSAFIWMVIYSMDIRFQGQGALGLAVFIGLGVAYTFVRLIAGFFLLLFVSLWRR